MARCRHDAKLSGTPEMLADPIALSMSGSGIAVPFPLVREASAPVRTDASREAPIAPNKEYDYPGHRFVRRAAYTVQYSQPIFGDRPKLNINRGLPSNFSLAPWAPLP